MLNRRAPCGRLGLSLALALLVASAPAKEVDLDLPNCEFTVKLPIKPDVKVGREKTGAATGPSMIAQVSNRVPGYRIECQSFASMPQNARSAFIDDTLGQAASLALKDMQQSVKQTRLGVVIEFSGINYQANVPFVVSGRNVLGRRSVFSVVVTEPAEAYPSEETSRVLKSVRKK
ncbi:MAG: hypothetical protein AAF458_16960 [Pseudomonadota bacterium]